MPFGELGKDVKNVLGAKLYNFIFGQSQHSQKNQTSLLIFPFSLFLSFYFPFLFLLSSALDTLPISWKGFDLTF